MSEDFPAPASPKSLSKKCTNDKDFRFLFMHDGLLFKYLNFFIILTKVTN